MIFLNNDILEKYINYNITKKVLQKYLANTQKANFTKETHDALTDFTLKAFKLHITYAYKKIQNQFITYKEVLKEIQSLNVIIQLLDIPICGQSNILRLYFV